MAFASAVMFIMKHTSLATRYRPQTFAAVAGQELVTSVLSRAAAEDRVAPAYLLSGTRGVGKTTIARILAKALNCTTAPTGEPCNQCEQCRKITQGNHVDVTEIDGASNNSVEDARALRETIGYAPMEGRYKVFIIDEAHMLSRSAFNALLKTLEEPPPRVVFIFATTEAHKFPITIVSRCQHFIFRRVPEAGLMTHLQTVLQAEHISYDEGAVRLIARRASGSVRDAMSLLGQTLALGGENLSVESTRSVLGLAGQDFFTRLVEALVSQNCLSLTELVREMLDQGVDIGFFLRELTSLWRNLFLIRQAGEAILPVLDLPEDEARQWCALAPRLSLTHIHAAWQMVLDAQRRVVHSPEPAAALELLLLNVALLPRLLPLEHMPGGESGGGVGQTGGEGSARASGPTSGAASGAVFGAASKSASGPASEAVSARGAAPIAAAPTGERQGAPNTAEQSASRQTFSSQSPSEHTLAGYADSAYENLPYDDTPLEAMPADDMPPPDVHFTDLHAGVEASPAASAVATPPVAVADVKPAHSSPRPAPAQEATAFTAAPAHAPRSAHAAATPPATASSPDMAEDGTAGESPAQGITPTWEGFFAYCTTHGNGQCPQHVLRQTKGVFAGNVLTLSTSALTLYQQLDRTQDAWKKMVKDYCGQDIQITIAPPTQLPKTEAELKEAFAQRDELKPLIEIFDARISRCPPLTTSNTQLG